MEKIDWNKFGLNGESRQDSFEDLCMFLCCRELGVTKINSYKNQPGIETEPFEVNGKKYGFQAKFYETGYDWKQIQKSILGLKAKNSDKKGLKKQYPNNVFGKYNLNEVIIYSNEDRTLDGSSKTVYEKRIEDLAKKYGTKVTYITHKDILRKLSKPSNLDLAQLYFGIGDEFRFIQNSTNPKILTFLQSKEYMDLPFVDSYKNSVNVSEKILSEGKFFLLTGHPGSGKSIFMHKLLTVFGGLDKEGMAEDTNEFIEPEVSEMISVLINNGAIPLLINLKSCISDSLENIIRGRKYDCMINGQNLHFIYLFDGLDELDENIVDNVLFQIQELSQKVDTEKIIISCRSGNLNRLRVKTYLKNLIEYNIDELDESYLKQYFEVKMSNSKNAKLEELMGHNQSLITEIKDVLLIKLIWDTIDELYNDSTIIDLFSKKINLLLNNPEHKKNIENLNLLNCKKQAIINLNQDIAFELQNKFHFRLSQKELQDIILNKYSRLDYRSINTIIDYIADLFFDNSSPAGSSQNENIYTYQHRRYQEFFFTQRLKTEYENDPKIIRKMKILANREYFKNLFLTYLRKEYKKENNLPGLVELNLIEHYLGKYEGFGVNDDYYMDSESFIPALASQEPEIFDELLDSEYLEIIRKISIDIPELKKKFEKWAANKTEYYPKDYLETVWKYGIPNLIKNRVLFWKSGKKDISNELKLQLDETIRLYQKYEFFEDFEIEMSSILDDQLENYIYSALAIGKKPLNEVFIKFIRGNYKNISEVNYSYKESGKEKLVKSFLRICLSENRNELYELIDDFENYEFIMLLDLFRRPEYLPIFINSESIHEKIRQFLQNFKDINEKNVFILFFKKYFDITISKDEMDIAKEMLSKLKTTRGIELKMYNTPINFANMSYIFNENSFEKFQKQNRIESKYYYELGLYSALFNDFILVLTGKKEIEKIIGDYIRYINNRKELYKPYLVETISFLWANIFSCINSEKELLKLKKILIRKENNIDSFSFYAQFQRLDSKKFSKIINRNDLSQIETDLIHSNNDFYEYVTKCFTISMFFSKIDTKKSISYFEKGILEGSLRHKWHKDIIISYLLVESLRILWDNQWESNTKLEEYTEEVFKLTLRVIDITDGDETRHGPYDLLELIAEYNLDMAERFKKQLIEHIGRHNISDRAITDILLKKIKYGMPIDEIEKGMDEYILRQGYDGKPDSEYYEQKFLIYLNIANSKLYNSEEKKSAFEKAYGQVEKVISHDTNHFLSEFQYSGEKHIFKKLCEKYRKKDILKFEEFENTSFSKKEKNNISEKQFIDLVKDCSNSEQIDEIYKRLIDRKYDLVLKNTESWKILINKTYDICGNIHLLTNYLNENYYPDTIHISAVSRYLHYALSEALKNMNTREEISNYLFENSGHAGFFNIIKAYEVIGNKEMCIRLFDRYLRVCKLLVK